MKNTPLIILAIVLLSACKAQVNPIEELKKDVYFLAADDLEGREIGTTGEMKAAEYLSKRFEEIGLSPKGTDGYIQSFDVTPAMNPHEEAKVGEKGDSTIVGHNVVGFIDNKAEETVIIGAHFDHLGYGDVGSLHRGDKAIHNGADDNASGTAAILQIATNLMKGPKHNNYLFIAFSGEEKGLWGSNYFSKNATVDLKKVNYMINLDMVGRLNAEKSLAINGTGTSPAWEAAFAEISADSMKLVKKESGVGPSDHTSFYLKDIPVLHFFTGQHADYHKPTDDADLINYEGINTIAGFITSLVTSLDDDGKIEFVKTKDDSGDTPRFTVTLGVVPDYLFGEKGMRIDGVSDGKPAQLAGIESGDIVLKMGDLDIDDMMGYMKALSSFSKGDKIIVVIKRGEEMLEKEVEL